jgi:predicted NBD/HSP70 family sugar kinase
MQHEQFQDWLDVLVRGSGVGQEVLGEVLARTSLRAPEETSRVEIALGNPVAHRPADEGVIPQGSVSKAVKALLGVGLIEEGERLLRNPDGRTLSPLRLGSGYAVAGVKVVLSREQPRRVTTALFGLDNSRVFATATDVAGSWDVVTDLIYLQVTSLKNECDRDRVGRGLRPLQLFGVGVGLGAPVRDGQVMPLSSNGNNTPIPLSARLHQLFEADSSFNRPVPVMVENDVDALAVLSIHQIHNADPDVVVVGVFDEQIGGGLIMDGRLRRGSNGRAMQIGHLAVDFPVGEEHERQIPGDGAAQFSAAEAGFNARCSCGRFGHVDTIATPQRILGEFGGGTLEQVSEIDSHDPKFQRASVVFTKSGAALGRAVAHVSSTVNPRKIIMYSPAALAEPKPDSAGAAYLTAVRAEAVRAFGASSQPDYLIIHSFPQDPEGIALLGAKAAAACVLESFVEHALRLDGCRPAVRHAVVSGSPPK